MSRSACSARSAAAAGAPWACAVRAASSKIAATLRSGSAVASARCRARSSADTTISASRVWSVRRRAGVWRAATAEPSRGWVNRRRSPSSSTIRASSASSSPASNQATTAASTSAIVGSASAATTRVTSSAAVPEAVDTRMQELLEARGNRELLAGSEGTAIALEGTCELEREKRVAARGLPESDQRRAGNVAPRRAWRSGGSLRGSGRRLQPCAVSLPGAGGEAIPGLRRGQPAGRRPAHRPSGRGRSQGPQPKQCPATGRRRLRRRRGRRRELSHRREERIIDCAVIGGELRLAEQQCGLKRPPLDRRQLGHDIADDIAEEIAQPSEREPRLGLQRAGRRGSENRRRSPP